MMPPAGFCAPQHILILVEQIDLISGLKPVVLKSSVQKRQVLEAQKNSKLTTVILNHL